MSLSVYRVTGLRAARLRNRGSIPGKAKSFFNYYKASRRTLVSLNIPSELRGFPVWGGG